MVHFKGLLRKKSLVTNILEKNRYYIEASTKKNQLYLQDDTRILSITTEGDIIDMFTNSAMKDARGLVIDDQDDILIGCIDSHNLHVFSCDGLKHKMLLSKEDQIAKPYCVAFRASDGTLAVGDFNFGIRINHLINTSVGWHSITV